MGLWHKRPPWLLLLAPEVALRNWLTGVADALLWCGYASAYLCVIDVTKPLDRGPALGSWYGCSVCSLGLFVHYMPAV